MRPGTPEYESYMVSAAWAAKREEVRARADNRCERCGGPFEHVHHLVYGTFGNEPLEHLKGLCKLCHEYLHRRTTVNPKKLQHASSLHITRPEVLADMAQLVGPLPAPTLTDAEGTLTFYLQRLEPDRYPKSRVLDWEGAKVGLFRRDDFVKEELAPGECWLVDIGLPLYVLPEWWREYLFDGGLPEWMDCGLPKGFDGISQDTAWSYPAEELLQAALQQPGGRRVSRGVQFQCPACREEDHDRHKDNAIVFWDGRWGCSYGHREHRHGIGEVLGALPPDLDIDSIYATDYTEGERRRAARVDFNEIDLGEI